MKIILYWTGFGYFMASAPFLAWLYPRTDPLFGTMNGLASASVAVATFFLGALFFNQSPAPTRVK